MSNKVRLLMMAITACINTLSADLLYAGNWSGGGGALIKDMFNPWFIQNTSKVTYCIARDNQSFHMNEEESFTLDDIIQKAVAYWKNEAKTAYNPQGEFAKEGVKIATQTFIRKPCDDNVDIRFQFGFLSANQLETMKKYGLQPKDYFSLAVRTDYDQVNLRGKGFIYLAADSGPLVPDSKVMGKMPWARGSGGVIYKVLVHELGHVFGIQHQSDLSGFMRADYVEAIIKNDDSGYAFFMPPFFDFMSTNEISLCLMLDLQPVAAKFFGIPKDWYCYETEFKERTLNVWAYPNAGADRVHIGTAHFEEANVANFDLPVSVWLPPKQKVYPPNIFKNIFESSRILYGPMIRHSNYKGVYMNKEKTIERPISASLSPNPGWNKFGGILDSRLLINIQANF